MGRAATTSSSPKSRCGPLDAAAVIRLAFCLDNFQIGGTELNAVRWVEQLDPAQFTLTVFHFHADGPLRTRFEHAGARLVHVPLRHLYGPGAFMQGIRLARRLARERVQVFHAQEIYSNIFGVPWARIAGVPAVIASRRWGPRTGRPAHRIANRWASRAAHRVVANSPSVAALVTREDGIPASRIVCMPNCVAEGAFQDLAAAERAWWRATLNVPDNAALIGITARLDRLKDHQTLFRAFARIAALFPETHLVCVGDGPMRRELTDLVRTLQLESRVHLVGTLTPSFNVHQLFDVSVLCSSTEGFPNAVIEAMAAARPVVATRVGGIVDAIHDQETGVLIEPGNAEALATALTQLLTAPDRARALGTAARAHVRGEYHQDRVIGRLSAWYASLAAPPREN